jgi:hypothetical protein
MRRLAALTIGGALLGPLCSLACGSDDAEAPKPSANAMVPDSGSDADASAAEGGGVPVIERVALSPAVPVPGSEITAVVDASDPDGDLLRYEFRWLYNGKEVQKGPQGALYVVDLAKGDRIEVEVTATDGRHTSKAVGARAAAGNRPPVLSAVTLEPFGDVRAGQTVTASPLAKDPDNDRLSFRYEWTVNGESRGRERDFDTTGLRRGDKVQVLVVASDGSSESREERSPVLMLGNSPPVIAQLPSSGGEDGTFRYTFAAKDPDGDRNLRFFVEKGPAGMRMDPITGVLTWTPTADQAGVHPVEVGVRDGAGEGSTFTFALTVRATPPGPAAGAR